MKLCCALFCSILLQGAEAQNSSRHDYQAEFVEPIVTEETMPADVGQWDLRMSCSYEQRRTTMPVDCLRTQLFFGIAPRWGGELGLSTSNVSGDRKNDSRGEVSATVKYVLRSPNQRGPALVLALESAAAIAKPGTAEAGRIEIRPAFAFLQPIGRTTLQGNIGYGFRPSANMTERSLGYNISAAVPLRPGRWYAFTELVGTAGTEPSTIAFSPGLRFPLGERHYAAIGVPIGMNSSSAAIGLMLQVQFSLKHPPRESEEHSL